MKIRLEEEKDYLEVENLTREAFWNVYRPGCFEHLVIHKLRNDKSFVKDLDFVIEEKGKIVGNIVYSLGKLKEYDGKITELLTFGPLSVLPEYQKKGYGKELIVQTLELAKMLGYPCVVITGNPDYYKKFGFVSASKYNIFYEGTDVSDEAPYFMIKVLNENEMSEYEGTYSDPDCFNIDEKELNEFDKSFPDKIKEVKEGQL